MPSLVDIPLEVLIDNILPYLPLSSIAALSLASKDLAALCSDETFWKRKLQADYNFSDASTARTTGGYKFLYSRFLHRNLYVWGSTGEGRLGLDISPRRAVGILSGSQPYPAKLDVPGSRIVEIVAGGWSFHALDSEGCIHVWGQLDGMGFGLNVDSFSLAHKRTSTPLKLALPEKITHISCGRAHAAALSAAHRVWVFTAWGAPYVVTAPVFATPPRQVECGWSFVAVLTQAGDVHVWWPFDGEFGEQTRAHESAGGDGAEEEDGVIQCLPWNLGAHPAQVRDVTGVLPKLLRNDEPVGEKIVKIAAGDNFLIGLTEEGHVLRMDFPLGHGSVASVQGSPRWEYLPLFSEVGHVREDPAFSAESGGTLVAPETMQITHISANFETFFAYSTGSSSIVLQGTKDTSQQPARPVIYPALQNCGVISVVVGDYHFGALTSAGKVLTWGAYSSGALGLGDPTRLPLGVPGGYTNEQQRANAVRMRTAPPNVTVPTEVKFGTSDGGEGRKTFVFSVAAAGWHMGALAIDLEQDSEEEEEEVEVEDEESEAPYPMPGHFPGRLTFRIGLAGARARGRGRGVF